jgi:effector-binding domain-containing protein
MFKIGDFSKVSHVSIKALRLYDQMGLLKPKQVDDFTGYRYYSASQLPRLNRILALKDLGFSLEQIAQLLDHEIEVSRIRSMFQDKQTDLQQHIETETARLARVEARLRQLEQEDKMSDYEVILKKVEPVLVASIRDTLASYSSISPLYGELFQYLSQQNVKPSYCLAIWHDPEYKETDVDGEAAFVIDRSIPESDRIHIHELPGYDTVATLMYQGSYSNITQPYSHLLAWIEANGYRIMAPNRELYIEGGSDQHNENYVTEIQFSVAKL